MGGTRIPKPFSIKKPIFSAKMLAKRYKIGGVLKK